MRKKLIVWVTSIIIIFSCVYCFGCTDNQQNYTNYKIDVTLNENQLTGSQTVDYFNNTETAISVLKFNLFGNAYRKNATYSPISSSHLVQSYPHGVNYGNMKIESVKKDNKQLEFSICGQDLNILEVKLDSEVYPRERKKITIDFTLNLANVISRTGVNDKTINLANFYPQLCVHDNEGFYECVYYSNGDPFYSDCANYQVKLTADKDYVVASSGKLISQNSNGEMITSTYQINKARSFAFVLSKSFKVESATNNGVQINYYYYEDETPTRSLEQAKQSLEYFSNTFGDYAFSQYSVVQTKFVQGGMEYCALVMISDNLDQRSYGEVIVHETAHQWWQVAVGNNEIEYGFLDEGLTEYSVVLFYENHPEYGMSRDYMVTSAEDTYKLFCSVSDKVFGKVNTAMIRSLKDFKGEYEYVNIAYIKPCIMFDYLRETIGDNKFFNGLKRYYENYKFKNAIPDDLVGVFEKIGADSNGFFKSFFDGKVII